MLKKFLKKSKALSSKGKIALKKYLKETGQLKK